MEHVQHDEPDGGSLGEIAEDRCEGRTENGGEVLPERLGTKNAEPHDGQQDEVHPRHGGRGEHGARHIAGGVLGLADMAGGGLKRGRGEADQVKAGHHRGQLAEEALERRDQMKVERLMPIDVAGEDGGEPRDEGERGGGRGDRHSKARHPFDAAEIDEAEQANDGDGDRFHGQFGDVPLLDG